MTNSIILSSILITNWSTNITLVPIDQDSVATIRQGEIYRQILFHELEGTNKVLCGASYGVLAGVVTKSNGVVKVEWVKAKE